MLNVQDTITTPLDDFHLVIEPFHKSTCLSVNKVIGYFIHPLLSCFQKIIEAMYFTVPHTLYPVFDLKLCPAFAHMLLKNLRECITQIIGNFHLWRMDKETSQLVFVLVSHLYFFFTQRPHHPLSLFIVFF